MNNKVSISVRHSYSYINSHNYLVFYYYYVFLRTMFFESFYAFSLDPPPCTFWPHTAVRTGCSPAQCPGTATNPDRRRISSHWRWDYRELRAALWVVLEVKTTENKLEIDIKTTSQGYVGVSKPKSPKIPVTILFLRIQGWTFIYKKWFRMMSLLTFFD